MLTLTQVQGGRRGDEERKTHGTNSALMAFGGFTRAVLSRRCPPPLYRLAPPQCMTQHVTHLHGWEVCEAEREPLLQTFYLRGETSGKLGEATD